MLSRKLLAFAAQIALALATVAVLAACGGDSVEDSALTQETATVPPTNTPVQFATDTAPADDAVAEPQPPVAVEAPTPVPTIVQVPTPTPEPVQRTGNVDYEVQSGDVLGIIAEQFGVTQQAILDANSSLSDPNALFVGQELVIPPQTAAGDVATGGDDGGDGDGGTEEPTATPEILVTFTPGPTATPFVVERTPGQVDTHTVREGQFLSVIARAYGVSIDSIVNLNGLSSPNSLFVGQQLQIPAEGTTGAGTPAATAAADATPTPAATADPALTATPVPTTDPAAPTMTPAPTVDPAAPTPTPTTDVGATLPTLTPTVAPAGTTVEGTPTPIPDCDPNNAFGFDCSGIPDDS